MISFKHLPRYKDLVWLLIKYGNSDLLLKLDIDESIEKVPSEETKGNASELAKDLQSLGPTYIKFGQFLSSQSDLISKPYIEALAHLQDNVEPFPFEEVERIVSSELGLPLNKAFTEFNPVPIAAASLSQVHRAITRSGRDVAVKVQRPGIEKQISEDLEVLKEIARFFDQNEILGKHFYWEEKIKSFGDALVNELDFRKEAHNLKVFTKNLAEFEDIIIPRPIDDYTTRHVLTMEYISSRKITTLHPLIKIDLEGKKLAEELLKAYLQQIFYDGFVHVDPHPGNLYITDTNQLALLDPGMVQRIPPQFQQDLLKLLIAISDGKGENAADIVIKLGHHEKNFKNYKFREEISDLVAANKDLRWEEMSMGKLLLKIAQLASEHGLRLPTKFNLLGKTLMNLDSIVRVLDPSFNPTNFILDNIAPLMEVRMDKLLSKSFYANFFLEIFDLVQIVPSKINSFLELFTKNEWILRVQAFDENRLMRGFEKVANRIAFGLVLAALIVGAALLMNIETSFRIFGYPGLAILLFLASALGGFVFLISILINDRKFKD